MLGQGDQVLGVPLDARTHQSASLQDDRFDEAVRRLGDRDEAVPRRLIAWWWRLLTCGVSRASTSPSGRSGLRSRWTVWARESFGSATLCSISARPGSWRREVLPERAAEEDVEHLDAAADSPDRDLRLPRRLRAAPTPLASRSAWTSTLALGEDLLAVALGRDVHAAAEHEAGGLAAQRPGRLRGHGVGRHHPDQVLGDADRLEGLDVGRRPLLVGGHDQDLALSLREVMPPPFRRGPRSPCRRRRTASRCPARRRASPGRAAG